MTKKVPPCSAEVRARAVRMVLDHREEHGTQWAAIQSIASKIGCSGETLRGWVRQAERDNGDRAGATSSGEGGTGPAAARVRELRQANEILKKASASHPSLESVV